MVNVTVLCVGSVKEPFLRDALAEYAKRLSAFCRFQVVELKEEKLPEKPSASEIARALDAEGKKMLEKTPPRSLCAALCVEGKQMPSEKFSELLASAEEKNPSIVFYIGSSFGLSDEVKKSADLRLSVSEMTFPHQLFRVMLCEQIYRAFQIRKGTAYHK